VSSKYGDALSNSNSGCTDHEMEFWKTLRAWAGSFRDRIAESADPGESREPDRSGPVA